ncbi:hypothetical protein ABFS82_08G207100 [Erythranthe guttata]|uniref:O-methyltransferase domain-containing protein n=1 Tax=Erythranthe guttata TaxID=4155 RepID=A0A022QQ03_ERYGU|nr:PREDICTED: 8-hydroxyquercetin 8-O-methyltransferase-like [Erythranthe guttata]EYU30782.1 hypothetical protein MIMGU_mgv1a021078mg [Erythranthe guttata]|eukprot:XP_012844862.1 PREDICTED: 8-hydroxyquercetin 8-O-methyltransferase-like [Erythranthe guttata]
MTSPSNNPSSQELFDAQAHVWNFIFNYLNSMSLKCAIQLGIPDIIHKHGKPMSLDQLVDALSIDKSKSRCVYRLMRILTHSKFFVEEEEEEEARYSLTLASRLLLKDEPLSIAPFALAMMDPILIEPCHHVSEWFQSNDEISCPFVTKYGMGFFEYARNKERWNKVFNEGMASDARFVNSLLIREYKQVFEGLDSIVDVGGGTGAAAKAIVSAFPGLKCTVLELPHVIAGLEGTDNLNFVGGDMFNFIPHAHAVFFKWIFHDWTDEECIKILEKCKEAITSGDNKTDGKVIIVEIVVDDQKENQKATETQLLFDMLMMIEVTGKERTEKEWANLFFSAGFSNYKITPVLGLRSIIEVFP